MMHHSQIWRNFAHLVKFHKSLANFVSFSYLAILGINLVNLLHFWANFIVPNSQIL